MGVLKRFRTLRKSFRKISRVHKARQRVLKGFRGFHRDVSVGILWGVYMSFKAFQLVSGSFREFPGASRGFRRLQESFRTPSNGLHYISLPLSGFQGVPGGFKEGLWREV